MSMPGGRLSLISVSIDMPEPICTIFLVQLIEFITKTLDRFCTRLLETCDDMTAFIIRSTSIGRIDGRNW